MKNIDFLPSRYHERHVRRKVAIWRCAILLAFGGFLCAASIGQWALKRSVQAALAEHQPTYREAKLKTERAAALERELLDLEERAELYTYLRHPWPRSQLLAAIVKDLPRPIVLREISIHLSDAANSGGRFAGAQTLTNEDTDSASAPKNDLARLKNENDNTPTVIQLNGTTRDTGALNRYVRAMGQSPLFQSASLSSLQSIDGDTGSDRSEFQVDIAVRPGYGQPGGPTAPLAPRDAVARRKSGGQL